MKTETFLADLLRDFHAAIQNPAIAKRVLFSSTIPDLRVRYIVRELLLADGNFETLKNAICWNPSTKSWRKKFIEWAEKTREKRRFLLPEKCGGES